MIEKPSAKELFAASLHEISAYRPVSRITVKDIAKNCGYSTATFYRLFRDKYDLIAWDYVRSLTQIMSQVGKDGYKWRDTLPEGAQYFASQREYILNVLRHTEGEDSLENTMISQNYNSLHQCAIDLSGEDVLDKQTDLCMLTYCMGTVRLSCEWLRGGFQAKPAEIALIWEKALPQPLYPYLYDS